MKRLTMTPALFFEEIMLPNFNDILPGFNGGYAPGLQEWTIMPDVPLGIGQTMIEITQNRGILQRKDMSCETNWSRVGSFGTRKIYVQELYAAVKNCADGFYDGAMKDFRNQNAHFQQMITQIARKAVGIDLYSNAWFGDVSRANNATFSMNKFDGVVAQIGRHITNGLIPAGQVLGALPDGAMDPTEAYEALKEMFEKRSVLLKAAGASGMNNIAFYIDYEWAYQYQEYLKSTVMNTTDAIGVIVNGVPALKYNGVPIFVEPLWNAMLQELNGGTMAHMGILTYRRNMVFGTNRSYGGGQMLDQAYRVWYSEDEETFKEKYHLVGGTELLAPREVVFAMTDIS